MKFVPNAISRKFARQALLIQKDAPTLLFGTGVVGMVGSTVLACRATLKLEEVTLKAQSDLDTAKSLDHPNYSDGDRRKDIAVIYTRSVLKVGRLYGPAVLIGAASVGCLTKSHSMLNERNVALTAAYAAVDKAFEQYRSRVVDKYGEDEDRELRYPTEVVEVLDEETGKVEQVKRIGADPDGWSMYARFFDEYSKSWSKEPEYNYLFLRCQQNYANDLLKARGHLFLNEVYDMLGLDRSKAGQVVGWVISNEGDNYVDFGLFDDRDNVRDFVNGREGSILLDFNVDGIIYDKITDPGERIAWQS